MRNSVLGETSRILSLQKFCPLTNIRKSDFRKTSGKSDFRKTSGTLFYNNSLELGVSLKFMIERSQISTLTIYHCEYDGANEKLY